METAQSLTIIDCHTDLTVSIFKGCFFIYYIDLVKKDLLLEVTFHSFLVLEIAGNKSQEFPDPVPFPLPIFGEVLQSLLVTTERKTDLSELPKEDLT